MCRVPCCSSGRVSACLHSVSTAVPATRTITSARDRQAASASDTRKDAGTATIAAATDQGESQCVPASGTRASSRFPFPVKLLPGMRWSAVHWSTPVNAPAATATAIAAKLRDANAKRTGHHLETRGRRADLFAVQLDRQPLWRGDGDRAGAQQLHLRMGEVRALVDLRRGRDEVALV